MNARQHWSTFALLFREEWRLHTRLFGGWRFALFPVLVAGLAVAGAYALTRTGTASESVVAGLHLFALGFGLYSGTAGFAGSDMLENVFGRLTLLLSSATTLPLSRRRLLGLFLLKDALFYAVVFVLPMALSVLGLEGPNATPGAVVSLWLSLCLAFAAGMAVTVGLIALRTRGAPGWSLVAGTGSLAVGAWWLVGPDRLLEAFPYVGSLRTGVAVAGATAALAAVALAVYDPSFGRPTRAAGDRFVGLEGRLPGANSGLVAKTLLDLTRSSGGVWKPLVSVVILLALVAFLVGVVAGITGLEPSPGVFFGGVLGLSAFTTYNWLTQFDAVEEYLAYPVSVDAVFRAKRTAFVLVGAPAVAVPYLAAVGWYGATALDAAVGALLLGGYGLYYYGLTVYIAGFDPNEFLFDAVRFAAFTVGVAVALVPALVVGFAVVPLTGPVAFALACSAGVFGSIGLALSSRAGRRWTSRYRDGTAQ
ncbi:hypothetical protein [Natrononativus amylolyticus]|uniref:hypothetical protein n=1 Tax=Natrononativus amylolyticus TaxID=2963434 RepID=UPI0020CBD09E|nr:hypothetical protein [Natrononativus amylolyticus]